MILTDAEGRPFVRPRRRDFKTWDGYAQASYALANAITECANKAFAESFKKEISKQR